MMRASAHPPACGYVAAAFLLPRRLIVFKKPIDRLLDPLLDWLEQRERDLYPKQDGYMTGPIAPPPAQILNQPEPLPEAVRGDAWSIAYIPLGMLKEAEGWPMEFSGLLPKKNK